MAKLVRLRRSQLRVDCNMVSCVVRSGPGASRQRSWVAWGSLSSAGLAAGGVRGEASYG